jgi:uncharacterized protein (DUF427 family)
MPKAVWNGVVIAESAATEIVEGRHYFPPEGVARAYLVRSGTQSECPWKGRATYFHVQVGGEVNTDAAFTYADPRPAAAAIKGYVAFWKGVEVDE